MLFRATTAVLQDREANANSNESSSSRRDKTFDWLIDESYDREIDDKRRFELVLNETKKLLDTPLDELNEKIQKNSDIFEHNFEKIKEFAYSEIDKIYKLFDVQ